MALRTVVGPGLGHIDEAPRLPREASVLQEAVAALDQSMQRLASIESHAGKLPRQRLASRIEGLHKVAYLQEEIAKAATPRSRLRLLRRLQWATSWYTARAEGQLRALAEVRRQQSHAVQALEVEAIAQELAERQGGGLYGVARQATVRQATGPPTSSAQVFLSTAASIFTSRAPFDRRGGTQWVTPGWSGSAAGRPSRSPSARATAGAT